MLTGLSLCVCAQAHSRPCVSVEVRGQPRDWVRSFLCVGSEDGALFLRAWGKLLYLLRISQEYYLISITPLSLLISLSLSQHPINASH